MSESQAGPGISFHTRPELKSSQEEMSLFLSPPQPSPHPHIPYFSNTLEVCPKDWHSEYFTGSLAQAWSSQEKHRQQLLTQPVQPGLQAQYPQDVLVQDFSGLLLCLCSF